MGPAHRPRSHARLRYPPAVRPSLILDSGSLHVVDLSERGLRYRQDFGPEPPIGATLEGILRLSSGETLPVRGTVVRIVHPAGEETGAIEVAAYLNDVGIPRRVIIAERQALQASPDQ
jgi:PilZ domain-containing protein